MLAQRWANVGARPLGQRWANWQIHVGPTLVSRRWPNVRVDVGPTLGQRRNASWGTNADLPWVRGGGGGGGGYCSIHSRSISLGILKLLYIYHIMHLNIILLKLLPHLLGANELKRSLESWLGMLTWPQWGPATYTWGQFQWEILDLLTHWSPVMPYGIRTLG